MTITTFIFSSKIGLADWYSAANVDKGSCCKKSNRPRYILSIKMQIKTQTELKNFKQERNCLVAK
jgi:hypothetical protein